MPAWHPHVDVWLVLGTVVGVYLVWCGRHERDTGEATSRRQRRAFLSGMAVLFLASEWPLHDLAERTWYAAHMVQHMAYTLVAAPLLIRGIPAWMWRSVFRNHTARRTWRAITRPVAATIIFNGVLLFTHWPAVVAASVGSEPLHFVLHTMIVASALIVWWPILSPLPEMPPITPPAQMLYLFVQSLVPTIPASFLTFGHQPLYQVYETFPRLLGVSALTDQLIAGLIMKIVGGLILWGYIAVVFFRWGARERQGWDALALRDVEADLRADLT
ncbi:MAG TPA: cytochrome c oxidase assembly protein [Actinomycetota bacterium]|nr:cytochrome c oxidase assembly protein [Actinomycetota bacterium]